jgi:hypothetical protein
VRTLRRVVAFRLGPPNLRIEVLPVVHHPKQCPKLLLANINVSERSWRARSSAWSRIRGSGLPERGLDGDLRRRDVG